MPSYSESKLLTRNQGDLCGAVFLDEAFENYLRVQYGDHRWKALTFDERHRVIQSHWERNAKQLFDPDRRTGTYAIDFPEQRSLALSKYVPF